eukprot:scaffold221251_cov32-Tisochrysis_lutea.AAC.7
MDETIHFRMCGTASLRASFLPKCTTLGLGRAERDLEQAVQRSGISVPTVTGSASPREHAHKQDF